MTESRFRAVKAYKNQAFLNSPGARGLRILAEYMEPAQRLDELDIKDTIVVFGSARIPPRDVAEKELADARANGGDVAKAERRVAVSRYYEDTRELCGRLTEWSKSLDDGRRFVICSGGGPGIMEATNRGASEAKGENIGFNISLPFEQSGNPYITRRMAFEFHYFFMRKFWFTYQAKAFIYMPGGFGTLDELFEVATLIQTQKTSKRAPMVLFGKEFWDRVVDFDLMIEMGTISPEDVNLFFRTDSVDEAFDHIVEWLERNELKRGRVAAE